jgi:hypothetical protein
LVVLLADGLGAGVELVEVVVGCLRDHQGPPARPLVCVGGVERGVLSGGLRVVEVQSLTGVVAVECRLVFTGAEVVLVAGIIGVVGAEVVGELHVRLVGVGGDFDVGP